MSFSAIAIIPVYNHPDTIGAMVAGVRQAGLPCMLVDDGSDAHCAAVLQALAQPSPDAGQAPVQYLRVPTNQGKGAAMMTGLAEAHRQGYSHALQIDADGQHACGDIPGMLARAAAQPHAMVCGVPVYDASVPKGRLYGRYLTHVWVWINTLSFDIRDSMCGFRVYPLAPCMAILQRARLGRRMEFDSEVLVRLHWAGVPIVNLPTRVVYPQDGLSHFKVWRDNVLISGMHARLFVGMCLRAPWLLWRRWTRAGRSAA